MLRLKSRLQLKDEKPEPQGFDYKEAILSVFSKNPNADLKIDDIIQHIFTEKKYTPNKEKMWVRMSYLVDRDSDPKIERVERKRGFYRLKKAIPTVT